VTILTGASVVPSSFDYDYFDNPNGMGYRGYGESDTGDGSQVSWKEIARFCVDRSILSAIDIGCAKGYLVRELVAHGVSATGCDVSDYALSFADPLLCHKRDIREGVLGRADAIFALGVLLYLDRDELPDVLSNLYKATRRYLLFSTYYRGHPQTVADPLRKITESRRLWRGKLRNAGFQYSAREMHFDVYEKSGHRSCS
jgi:hypothetical protein